MSEWIKERVKQIRQRERDLEGDKRWELHKAERLLASRLEHWKAVFSEVKSDADSFNQEFRDDTKKQIAFIEVPSHTLTLKKSSFPAVFVTASISPDGRHVNYKITEHSGLQPTDREGKVTIELDATDGFVLKHQDARLNSFREVSELLFEPILKAYEQ